MTDVKRVDPKPGANLLYLRDEELRQGIELLFFAYRDFTSDPDSLLEQYGFGRAHHRVIHFVGRKPGLNVAELLSILRITKQSLSRVLKQLVERGFIVQEPGRRDRRQRLLYLTEAGAELERRLSQPQRERMARAFREAGPAAVAGYRKVLLGLIDEERRAAVLDLLERD
jgi:DNA-binding MarR family transcriptional regulator